MQDAKLKAVYSRRLDVSVIPLLISDYSNGHIAWESPRALLEDQRSPPNTRKLVKYAEANSDDEPVYEEPEGYAGPSRRGAVLSSAAVFGGKYTIFPKDGRDGKVEILFATATRTGSRWRRPVRPVSIGTCIFFTSCTLLSYVYIQRGAHS